MRWRFVAGLLAFVGLSVGIAVAAVESPPPPGKSYYSGGGTVPTGEGFDLSASRDASGNVCLKLRFAKGATAATCQLPFTNRITPTVGAIAGTGSLVFGIAHTRVGQVQARLDNGTVISASFYPAPRELALRRVRFFAAFGQAGTRIARIRALDRCGHLLAAYEVSPSGVLSPGPPPASMPPDRVCSRRVASVDRAVRNAIRAGVHGNVRRACGYATARGRRRLLAGYNSSNGPGFPNCEAILRSEIAGQPYLIKSLRRRTFISEVRVNGRRARSVVAAKPGPYAGRVTLWLIRQAGRWRIDNTDAIPYGD